MTPRLSVARPRCLIAVLAGTAPRERAIGTARLCRRQPRQLLGQRRRGRWPLGRRRASSAAWRSRSTSTSSSRSSFQPTPSPGRTPAMSVSFAPPGASPRGDRAAGRHHPLRQGARDHGQRLGSRHHSPGGGKTPDAGPHRRRDEPTRERPDRPIRRSRSRKASTRNTPPSSAAPRSSTRNIGGPTIGANLAIALTPQLSIVPDVRYDYGSIGDEINNTLRTSVRMQWRF